MTSMRHAKPMLIFLLANSIFIHGQEYKVTLWSFPIVAIEMNIDASGKIAYNTESIGIMDYIWPVSYTHLTLPTSDLV